MKKTEYLNKRKALLDEAQTLIDEGKLAEFEDKKKEIEKLDSDYEAQTKAEANLRAMTEAPAVVDAFGAGVGGVIGAMGQADTEEDIYDSSEYRKAFMNYVTRGEAIPEKFVNAAKTGDANTTTSSIGSVIPTTLMEKIIERIDAIGMVLPLVTRTAYKGGVKIPTSTVKPVATWVAEGAGSEKQAMSTGSIDFAYNKLRCAVSVSLEVDTMALTVFETTFIRNVADAMVKALEQSIIDGSGSGQPKGIMAETPVDGQALELKATDKLSYNTLVDAEAALPLAYENGAVWLMTKKTFMAFVGMVDSNKQPIARVNAGINGRPERTLLGRTVILNDYMGSYAESVTEDVTFAALFKMDDYVLNTNLDVTVKRYEDNDNDNQVTKAVMLVDGKVVDKNSLVTITKKKAA